MSSKTVIVLFPVVIEIKDNDTIESVMDEASEILGSINIMPIIQTINGEELTSKEEFEHFKLNLKQ